MLKQTETDSPKLGYRPELDGFRGISILLVLIHHLYHPILPGGFLGVDIFFVLSGFLITTLLLDEWHLSGTINLKKFYIRRFLRLMPAVFLVIFLLLIYSSFFVEKQETDKAFQGIWLTLSYASNWLYAFNIASADNPLGVTWSLAIEEQFYLIFPLLLFLAFKYKLRLSQINYTLVLAILTIALHRKILLEQNASLLRLYYASDTRADALLVGCLTAFLLSHDVLRLKKFESYFKFGAIISLGFLCFMVATSSWADLFLYENGGYTLVAFSVALILIVILTYQLKIALVILTFAPLVWIGRVSYGLYLWHWVVRYFVYNKNELPSSAQQLVLALILTFALTIVSFYWVETPFLRLKQQFNSIRR